LKKQEGIKTEIVVVDNCSPKEGELDAIQLLCEETDCTFISAKENRGYNAGNNIGLRYAAEKGYKYALIANPDMEFPQTDYLVKMVDAMETDEDIVVCGSDIVGVNGVHQNPMKLDSKDRLDTFGWITNFFHAKKKFTYDFIDNYQENHYCYKISGCCLLVDVELIKNQNFFDEHVFLYCEEAILSQQILRAGKRLYYLADCTAVHRHVKSEKGDPRPKYKTWRNSRLYYIKTYSGYSWWRKCIASASIRIYTVLLFLLSFLRITIQQVKTLIGDNASHSLLTADESNAVKGLLILLIILGHNKFLMKDGYCIRFLYSFHVYSFYFLPFLYDYHPESWRQFFKKNLRRLYVPYSFFFFILLMVRLVQAQNLNAGKIITAFLTGTQSNLHGAFQYGSFLWFIPTFFSLLLFKKCYYTYPKLRIPLLIGSAITWYSFAFAFFLNVRANAPFSSFLGLAMLLPGVLCRQIVSKVKLEKLSFLFFFLVIVILIIYPPNDFYEYFFCNRFLCPFIVFSLLVKLRSVYSGNNLIREFGQNSFRIYLIHIFIYNGFYSIMSHSPFLFQGYFGELILFVVAAFLSLWIGRLKFWNYLFLR
jgi:hypothetical protein